MDLWGLSASVNNVLKVSIDDPTAFEAAADKYLMGGKEGVAGQTPIDGIALTNSEGQIIHTFTNDKAIKQYANSLNTEEGNLVNVLNSGSTVTGLVGEALGSTELGVVSIILGIPGTIKDISNAIENPTINNITTATLDIMAAIPITGFATGSYCLKETKETAEEVYEMEKAIRQEIRQLFGGK